MRRVLFLHPWVSSLKEMVDYLSLSDDIMRQAVWDERNPELVFVSEHVFYKPEYMRKVRSLYKDGRVFAFHGGEAIYPDLNIFDYAVVYSRYLNEADRIIGLPEQVVFKSVGFGKNDYDEGQALKSLKEREFCSFIYSNGSAHGYLSGAYVRDKDGVNGALLICEMLAYHKAHGKGIIARLQEIYAEYGYSLNTLHSYQFEGAAGMQKMRAIMSAFRDK